MEKCGKFRKNGRFSGRIWPDWGNTTRADMAGLGSIGLKKKKSFLGYDPVTMLTLRVKSPSMINDHIFYYVSYIETEAVDSLHMFST